MLRGPRPPWAELPGALGPVVRPFLPEITAAVIAALPQEVPAYGRPLEGAFGDGIQLGVGVALGRFLDLPGTDEPAVSGRDRDVYVALGRGELRQGRELEALLSAYRVGARVAFRRFALVARDGGFDADVLVTLAEATFAYIDELSSASVEGYAQEQSLRAGESGRRRTELLGMLLAPSVDPAAVAFASARAGWTLPEEVVAVVVPLARAGGLALALGDAALVGEQGEQVVAVLAASSGLERRLRGREAVIGPVRPWALTASSLRLAVLAAATLPLSGDALRVEDHRSTLLGFGLPDLADDLCRDMLAPLEGAPERLAETLHSWLRHRGERQKVAAELHVHTQTVGYRLGQLRELFGEALEDPDRRFELELALRHRAALSLRPTQ